MKRLLYSGLLCAIFALTASVGAQESVYPDNYNVAAEYHQSDTLLSAADTLVITRTLTNSESFPLTGLYFSENLPAGLSVIDYALTVNGAPITPAFTGPLTNNVLSGFRTYRWVIDSPDPTENTSRPISPGDQVRLEYRIVPHEIGDFSLPLHTTVAWSDAGGLFAADHSSLRVVIASDTIDGDPDDLLPVTWLVTSAYPNPFNAEVSISYEGANLEDSPIDFEVYNMLGQKLARYRLLADSNVGVVRWSPDAATGTGIFLYRLSCKGSTSTGKLMLLK